MNEHVEAVLRDLGAEVHFPPTPDLAGAVRHRLRRQPSGRDVRRRWGRALLLAAALTLILAAAAVALSLMLPGLRIVPVASVPGSPSAPDLGDRLALGFPISPDAERGIAIGELGAPDAAYESRDGVVTSVIYAARAGLPELESSGIGLVMQRVEGDLEAASIEKLVDEVGARVTPVTVEDAPGFWISGPPHLVRYLGADGRQRAEMTRLAGDTLVWQADGVIYRMETSLGLADALRLATSIGE